MWVDRKISLGVSDFGGLAKKGAIYTLRQSIESNTSVTAARIPTIQVLRSSTMPSKKRSEGTCCSCCSRTALIICLAVTGLLLLVLGLIFSVGGVFSNIIDDEVDKVSFKISYPSLR